jgi:plastocyanin
MNTLINVQNHKDQHATRLILFSVVTALIAILLSNMMSFGAGEAAVFVIDSTTYQSGGISNTMDAAPFIKDGRTLVPVRYLALSLGVTDANIKWDAAQQKITLVKGLTTVVLKIGDTTYQINGKDTVMDVAPLIKEGRTYLPALYVANAFDYKVEWVPETRTVLVTDNITAPPTPIPVAKTYTVKIADYAYSPQTLTINSGDTVIWTNSDNVNHTVTGGILDSPLFGAGESFKFTFTTKGTYDYICTPHPYMKGSVIVN